MAQLVEDHQQLLPAASDEAATAMNHSEQAVATVASVAYCYILPTICILGIIGNAANLIVLASRRLRAVSYMYLRALAVADLLCMLFVLIYVIAEVLQRRGFQFSAYRLYSFYQRHLMLTLINWALGTGVFVVMALSLERYVSIVFPLHFRAWNCSQRASNAIKIAYILPLLLYAPYGIARYDAVEKWDAENNVTTYHLDDSPVSRTNAWKAYKWTREAALRFGPLVILCVLNCQIMVAFRRRQRMFAQLTKRRRDADAASHRRDASNKDDTLLYMLGGTVIMFFICNIPAAINLIVIDEVNSHYVREMRMLQALKKRLDYQIFRAAANILEIANHASQFYVFCACSTDYRITFLRKFPCFQKSYANRRMRSFVKRTQSVMTRAERGSSPPHWISVLFFLQSQFASHFKDDVIATEEQIERQFGAVESGEEPRHDLCHDASHSQQNVGCVDPDTVDVHFASGESDGVSTDRECDALIRYGLLAKLSNSGSGAVNEDTAMSTFL